MKIVNVEKKLIDKLTEEFMKILMRTIWFIMRLQMIMEEYATLPQYT